MLQDFKIGVPARLSHCLVYLLPGCDTTKTAGGVGGSLAQQLCVLAKLGNVPFSGVALAQQLLRAQRYVQQA